LKRTERSTVPKYKLRLIVCHWVCQKSCLCSVECHENCYERS